MQASAPVTPKPPKWPSTDYMRESMESAARGEQWDRFKSAVNTWGEEGPHKVRVGIEDIAKGDISKGAHKVIVGSGVTALPMVAPGITRAFAAAPVATAATATGAVSGAVVGSEVARTVATEMGASDDQAALAGDIGGIGGGGLVVKGVPAAVSKWRAASRTKDGLQSTFAFKQAVPPTSTTPYTPEQFNRASPYLDVEHAAKPIQTVESLRDAADNAISAIEAHIGTAVDAHPSDLIRVNVVDAVKAALMKSPRKSALNAGLRELDDLGLDQPLTVQRAEQIRRQLNAENSALLKKNSYDVSTARQADPGFAAREAAAKSLRDGIYQQLEARGIQGVRELRQDEGALIAIRNASERQMFNAEKRVSGTGSNGPVRRVIADVTRIAPKVGPYIADVVAKPNQTRDQLVRRAFELRHPAPTPRMPEIPDDAPIRGLLGPGPRAMGGPTGGSVQGVPARYVIQKDPRTGKPIRVYLSDGN